MFYSEQAFEKTSENSHLWMNFQVFCIALPRISDLNTHLKIPTGKNPYVCGTNGKCSTTNKDLKLYQKIHPREIMCVTCGYAFDRVNFVDNILEYTMDRNHEYRTCRQLIKLTRYCRKRCCRILSQVNKFNFQDTIENFLSD